MLSPYRVLDFTDEPGALAGFVLASLGAEGARIYLSDTLAEVGPAPTLGQHTLPVLETILGYDPDRITRLVVSGALE